MSHVPCKLVGCPTTPGRRILLALGFALLAVIGPSETFAQEGTSKISPTQLFTGELKRLEPHLGLIGHGCVNVAFSGEKQLKTELQIWNKGKSTTTTSNTRVPVSAGEISITAREAAGPEGKMMYKVIIAVPGGTSSTWIPIPSEMRGTTWITVPDEKSVKDGDPIVVWALIGTMSGSLTTTSEPVEQAAARADWALVLSVTLSAKK